MTEQWQELKETIIELRDNDGTGTQQDVCKFLVDYMEVLEKQMQQPCEDAVSRTLVHEAITASIAESENPYEMWQRIEALPSVIPQTVTEFAGKCRECGEMLNDKLQLCEDAVSRQDVDAYIAKLMSGYLYDEERTRLEEFSAYLWELPSVTPRMIQGMDETKLDAIEQYLIDNVFENPDVMFSDECRGEEVDLVSIIAGMFEYLHIMVKGEPYEYMFHWANKIGAWVEEKRFDEMICRIMSGGREEGRKP